MAGPRIAIVGWGSLLWDDRPDFDRWHGPWRHDGPVLRLEFARVSPSRGGALTLVIDEEAGAPCATSYALSRREDPDHAIEDLRIRENATTSDVIGFHFAVGDRRCAPSVPEVIPDFARALGLDVVIWTGYGPNFRKVLGVPFSVTAAEAYLRQLDADGRKQAIRYIAMAPDRVVTPLRTAIGLRPL